ncbi:hypothetical protein G6F37_006887 [Rhizopus arrhizus]|nr:hypothetical protein G6F38_007097 [Rhizopus arrhizus]KAG1157239.1 hypothetical protein G6F37_006887 [Rhizopus arrhizus]
MPSPPKPWEVNNNTTTVTSPSAAAELSTAPDIPTRTNMTDTITTPARPTGYGSNLGYGGINSYGTTTTGYGGYNSYGGGGYGSYGGGYGSYGGGYGSYGGGGYGSYGSYGSSYGRYGMGMNRFGPGGRPGEDMSLTQRMEMGTRPTFEIIENIVGSFGGFAQMLESTFMATHSSFMAIMGVAEQFGHLRNYLGQMFSIFALYRLMKRWIQKLTGQKTSTNLSVSAFERFEEKQKMSRKPLIVFLLMVVGFPYLMHKLIQLVSKNQQQQQRQQQLTPLDPSKLEFARAMYDFTAESQTELTLKKGDIVAIITKLDPVTNTTGQWWRGRLRDGTMGMFPANYVEIIQKAPQQEKDTTVAVKQEE